MANKITLDQIEFFTPSVLNISNASIQNGDKVYYKHNNKSFGNREFLFFPIVLNNDNSIWEHGSRFLLYKVKSYATDNKSTLKSIADDLRDYKTFIENENIDYLEVKSKWQRPTVKYRNYLNKLEKNGNIADSTLRRKINTVCQFYDWLKDEEGYKFKFDMCIKGDFRISYTNSYGLTQIKNLQTNDVAKIRKSKNSMLIEDGIVDDGNILHPLTKEQQHLILKSLLVLDRYDIFLMVLISLTTGARLQTIGTLRLYNFDKKIEKNQSDVAIKAGYRTGVDTKNNKLGYLYFPAWVYRRIQIYISSDISKKRRDKAKYVFENESENYVFMTAQGNPYYTSKEDVYKRFYKIAKDGSSLRKFLSQTLKPYLKKRGNKFNFSFHDFRATFGMNILDACMKEVKMGRMNESRMLIEIKERMWHNDLSTTERYLKYKDRYKFKESIRDDLEKEMFDLIEEIQND